jgi:L-arabinokinase
VEVRVAAFMGYRIIADRLGYSVFSSEEAGKVRIEDPKSRGYLANIGVSEWTNGLLRAVPDELDGEQFLRRYGGITDQFTQVDPKHTYRVRAATAHPILEQQRVRTFSRLIAGASPRSAPLLGELMRQAHSSYSACQLGSEQTDLLVNLVHQATGLYGAKVSGRGGGCVAVLGEADSDAVLYAVARTYRAETGLDARIIAGSSPGAADYGTRRARFRLNRWWLD